MIKQPAPRRRSTAVLRSLHAALVAAVTLWIGGCATSADPHEGGFVSGVVGLMGGGYQRRVDERQNTYQGELNAQQRLQAEAQQVQAERDAVRGQLANANARLAAIERRIAAERAQIKAASARSTDAQAQLRRLDQAQAQVRKTQGAIRGVRPDQQPVGDLKARSAAIHRDLDQIDRMVASVSGKGF
jgi:chromosome segregation ATPase